MADMKNSALAKLATMLEADIGIIRAFKGDLGDKEDEVGGMVMRDIRKASRIVSELAKVSEGSWVEDRGGKFYLCRLESRVIETAVGKCRAIAEERVANDNSHNQQADRND